jgi:hypothetical protein
MVVKLIGPAMAVVIAMLASSDAFSATDCKSLADSAARLACFDASSKSPPKSAPAKLSPARAAILRSKSRIFVDPDSVRDARVGQPYKCPSGGGDICICLEVNAKNTSGGMAGLQVIGLWIKGDAAESFGKMYDEAACGKLEPFPELNGKR